MHIRINSKEGGLLKPSQGFTLVELMIATAVFSTILLLATTGIINIGRLYYKGVITARTQETTRSVVDEVSRSVQLTRDEIKTSTGASVYTAKCIGSDRYTYSIDDQVDDDTHGLWLDEIEAGDPCVPSNFSSGKELLSTNMRLLDFAIREDINQEDINDDSVDRTKVDIRVSVAYGDNDLLTHYDDNGNPILGANPADGQCKSTNAGGSFCSVSTLETFVKRRFVIVYLSVSG